MRHFFIFFLLFYSFLAFAQNDLILLSEIKFDGNDKTDSNYLKRELGLTIDSIYSINTISLNVQSLTRLSGLYEVDFELIDIVEKDGKLLWVHIKEQTTLLPVINFGSADNYRWFQLGVVDINLFGKGNEIYTYYQNNGGKHAGQLFYKMPNILGSRLGWSVNLLKWNSIEPLNIGDNRLNYLYKNSLAGLSTHYELDRQHSFELGASFFKEEYEKEKRIEYTGIGPDSLILSKLLIKLQFVRNKLNYQHNTPTGHQFEFLYQSVYSEKIKELFHVVQLKLYYLKQIKNNLDFATRSVIGLSTHSSSPFSPFVIDSYQNIRGVGDRVLRGTAIVSLNLELRYTLWQGNLWEFQQVTFADFGAIRTPGVDLTKIIDEMCRRNYAGLGLRIGYKKIHNALLRVDYGINLSDMEDRSLVIGLGQYF